MANKILGVPLPKGSQEKAAIVAAVAGVILVFVALRSRSGSSGAAVATTAPVTTSGDLLAAVSTGASAASNGLAFGAQVAAGGLSLAQSVSQVLGNVTTQLGDSLSRVALGQQDLIAKLATPKVQTVIYQPSPFVAPPPPIVKTKDVVVVDKPAPSAQDQRISALQAAGYSAAAARIDATTSADKPYVLDNFAITKDTADFLKSFGANVKAA